MKKENMPFFGVSAGFATAMGYCPHILFLLCIALIQGKSFAPLFLMFTLGARVAGDWIFWSQIFPDRMDSTNVRKDWRSLVRGFLFQKEDFKNAIALLTVDVAVDVALIAIALQVIGNSVWVFLIVAIFQAIGSIFFGVMIYSFGKNTAGIVSTVVSLIAIGLAAGINGIFPSDFSHFYMGIIHSVSISPSTVMLLVLGGRSFFSGISIVAKTKLAETIKKEVTQGVRV